VINSLLLQIIKISPFNFIKLFESNSTCFTYYLIQALRRT